MFSNGPTWVQNLSLALNLGTLAPSLAGGTDFAYGGAETGSTPQNGGDLRIQAISLPTQLGQFKARVPAPSANALYTVSIGANDLLGILAKPNLTTQQQTADVNAAVANEIDFVKQLVSNGAKSLLVLDVPDLSKTPIVTATQPAANAARLALSRKSIILVISRFPCSYFPPKRQIRHDCFRTASACASVMSTTRSSIEKKPQARWGRFAFR